MLTQSPTPAAPVAPIAEGRLASLETGMNTVTSTVSNSVASLTTSVNAQLAEAAGAAAAQARNAAVTLSRSLGEIDVTVSTAMGEMDTRINTSLSRAAAIQTASVATITAAVARKADAQPKVRPRHRFESCMRDSRPLLP